MKIKLSTNQYLTLKYMILSIGIATFIGIVGRLDNDDFPKILEISLYHPDRLLIFILPGFCSLLALYFLCKMKLIIIDDKPLEKLQRVFQWITTYMIALMFGVYFLLIVYFYSIKFNI